MKTAETRRILAKIDSAINGAEFTSSEKSNLLMALFDVSIEHAKSITILIENGKFGSAYALGRSMFETFIRGAWIQYCATNEEIKRFSQRDRIKKEFGELIAEVEITKKWPNLFSQIKDKSYKNLNSYTHGGNQILSRRFKDGNLMHFPDIDEINALLRLSALVAFLCFLSISEVATIKNAALIAEDLNKEMKDTLFNK